MPDMPDPNTYYRLSCKWQGDQKVLDVINDGNNNQLHLATVGNYTGQSWRFTPVGNGYYRISCQWLGEGKSIDIRNDGNNNQPILAQSGDYTGQYWKLTSVDDVYFRFSCQWQGENKSLDIVNDGSNEKLILGNTGGFLGQYWRLTPAIPVDLNQGYYLIVVSDPQYPWTEKTDAKIPETDDEKVARADILNRDHAQSIRTLINSLGPNSVTGILMNGDMTAYGHSNELDKYKSFYEGLGPRIYVGLGNHDYANNVDDTYQNNAANRMVDYAVSEIQKLSPRNFDYQQFDDYVFPEIRTHHVGSLAYSWDIGNVHFVQLHNYPIYERNWESYVSGDAKRQIYQIKSSLQWLKNDLTLARNEGKIIILNIHDPLEHWLDASSGQQLCDEFSKMLVDFQVSAVFSGHIHENIGRIDMTYNTPDFKNVPVFFSGSASQSKYLLVKIDGLQMTVEKVSSQDGGVSRFDAETIPLIAAQPPAPLPVPRPDGWVSFFNEAGYVARYTLTYRLNDQDHTFSTGNLALGNKQRYEIPGDATNVRVKGEGQTGLL